MFLSPIVFPSQTYKLPLSVPAINFPPSFEKLIAVIYCVASIPNPLNAVHEFVFQIRTTLSLQAATNLLSKYLISIT